MKKLNLKVDSVLAHELDILLNLGKQTFVDAYSHMNSADNMEAYLRHHFNKEVFIQQFNNPNSEFYFVKTGDIILGYIKVNFNEAQTELKDPQGMEIERIYVLKEYQGNKIGQYLIQFVKQHAVRKKLNFVWLGVWDQNLNAMRFYERLGFSAFDEHVFIFGDEHQTDIMMKMEVI